MPTYDTVIRGGRVLDPANGTDAILDVGILHGKIDAVGEGLDPSAGGRTIDASGRWVMPGHIDTHAHVSSAGDERTVDRALGLAMLAESGTTTCLDLLGTPESLSDGMRRLGAGINVATVMALIPHHTIPEDDPPIALMRDVVSDALSRGAIGVKMIGGYHPFTPESTAGVIEAANEQTAWVAFHLATKDSSSTLEGLREVPDLLGKGRLHVAHVNSYCRGMILPADQECREAFEILERVRGQVVTESYLAQMNGTNGLCDEEGNIVANVPQNCLRARGYATTEAGMRQALLDGYGYAQTVRDGRVILVTGQEAVDIWEAAKTNAGLSFPVNPASSAFTLATERYDAAAGSLPEQAEFRVDAVSTDGGAIPRNVAIERTMALVNFGALSPLDAARKLSFNPSRMLGLLDKGHFSEGADADVTIVNPDSGLAAMSLVEGGVIMENGRSVASGGTWIVTAAGENAAKASGLKHEVVDLEASQLYTGWR
ncbi:MAG: amidohydrolase family protein [Chloroflexi bacterium]|nr:amidohydrolase family protein [Chloroflexota bacterium]